MRVLVIPDIHLKTWIFDRAEAILKAGKADRAIEFAKTYPDTLWCYGNHDVSYPSAG